jgi:D-methionine transport system ATP-binding protein
VFLALAEAGVAFELIYGGINDIRGRVFGHLTLALTGDRGDIDRVLAAVSAQVDVTEAPRHG